MSLSLLLLMHTCLSVNILSIRLPSYPYSLIKKSPCTANRPRFSLPWDFIGGFVVWDGLHPAESPGPVTGWLRVCLSLWQWVLCASARFCLWKKERKRKKEKKKSPQRALIYFMLWDVACLQWQCNLKKYMEGWKIICSNLSRCFLDVIGIWLPFSAGSEDINVPEL